AVLEARLVRLTLETGKAEELNFPQQLLDERPDLAERETEVYETRKQGLDDKLESLQTRRDLANEEFDLKKPLVERNSIPRSDIIELQREIAEIEGSIRDTNNQYRSIAFEAFDKTKAELELLNEAIKAYEVRVSRTVMKSPINGTINALHKKTVGSVIGAGEDILEIVPDDDTLLIEALIRPSDRAFLRPEQDAVVKVTAYDFAIYGGLDGKLETISADTVLQEETGQRLYQIKVRTDENGLTRDGEFLPILPGMVVEVDIKTGQRTVLQYLLKPFNRARGRALTER
ncbi:MAG: HlyD family efflux transporter periplasmic adaptor subunit, partial [Verrucomicrobiota bacterium]